MGNLQLDILVLVSLILAVGCQIFNLSRANGKGVLKVITYVLSLIGWALFAGRSVYVMYINGDIIISITGSVAFILLTVVEVIRVFKECNHPVHLCKAAHTSCYEHQYV